MGSTSVLSLGFSGCADQPQGEEGPALSESDQRLIRAKPIPASLKVPSGNYLGLVLAAQGVQIYTCKIGTDGTSYTWSFVEPDAQLYGLFHWPVGHHYAGPTWEAKDGSTVVGTRVAGEIVDATAIPWLLLQGTGHSGKGLFSRVTYVQRLDTVGGLAPTTGCDAAHVGAGAEIDYTAKYAFYF